MFLEVFEADVDAKDDDGAKDGLGEHTCAAETAHGCGAPDGGGGCKTLHRVAVLEDDTGA